jgi:precorrin-2 dehydrogenase
MGDLFPFFLKLDGRRCVIVGAGKVAEQKIQGLLAAGADVHVVAPDASPAFRRLAENGRVSWLARRFEPGDLDEAFMVIAATGDALVNEYIFREAESRRVLCNAVDEPERCHFYYPAVVRRGDLQIAISTAGQSPALAQRLRVELEAMFGPEYQAWLQWLGNVRKLLYERHVDPQRRKLALHRIASREIYERFASARARRVRETA